MKVDYKNYPILENLHRGSISNIPIYPEDLIVWLQIKSMFKEVWKNNINEFRKEVNVISNPFRQACIKSSSSILGLYLDTIDGNIDIPIQGTFIVNNTVYMVNITLISGKLTQILYSFTRHGHPLTVQIGTNDENDKGLKFVANVASKITNVIDEESANAFLSYQISMVTAYAMFKSYANVETKILMPHQRPRDISCIYRNNTKFPITFLDSKWFTTLVKSEGFNVRGHFRLQPKKKDGKWTKELIWINEFRKTGYTAPARKLSYNNN